MYQLDTIQNFDRDIISQNKAHQNGINRHYKEHYNKLILLTIPSITSKLK